LAGVLLAVACVYALTRSSLLDVDRVQVVGGPTTGAEAIRAAAGIRPGDQMVDLDLTAARARIEALPWVRSARLARAWPGTVRIVVAERQPVARIADGAGHWWLADGTGRLLALVPTPPDGLVEVAGVVGGGQPGARLAPRAASALAMIQRLPAEVAARTVGLRFRGDTEIDLVVRGEGEATDGASTDATDGGATAGADSGVDGVTLDVPPPFALALLDGSDRVDDALVALDAVLSQVDDRCLATVDVRVPDKPVVTRRDNCR
jgi:cell division protein FtsQ